MSEEIKNRSEILFIYDIRDGNPNGDPLDENKPRIDEERWINLVTDVRLKRTIREMRVWRACPRPTLRRAKKVSRGVTKLVMTRTSFSKGTVVIKNINPTPKTISIKPVNMSPACREGPPKLKMY